MKRSEEKNCGIGNGGRKIEHNIAKWMQGEGILEKAVKIDNESRIFIGRLGIEMAKLALRE